MNNSILDILIQEKFKKVLDAKKEGKLYDFKKELKKEIMSKEEEIKSLHKDEWNSIKKIVNEIDGLNTNSHSMH